MVWLPMTDPGRPPRRLGDLWIKLLDSSIHGFPPIIRVVDLLARLYQLNVGLCNDTAVGLLEILKNLLIVQTQDFGLFDGDGGILV